MELTTRPEDRNANSKAVGVCTVKRRSVTTRLDRVGELVGGQGPHGHTTIPICVGVGRATDRPFDRPADPPLEGEGGEGARGREGGWAIGPTTGRMPDRAID